MRPMDDRKFLVLMALAGILVGLGAYQMAQQSNVDPEGKSYCTALGNQLQENGSFNGTVNCYPPGVLNVEDNISESVEDNTELQCVCRNTYQGNEHIFAVRKSR